MDPIALFFFCAVLAATSTNGTSGDNRYFADIMSQALMENTDKNMVYSPSSAHTILSLAYHASDGNTREILAETLDIVDEERRENENNLESEGVEWYRANSIYLSSRYELSADFANKARSFGAQAENIDFSDGENAAALMNGWIENKTDRMIKDLVDPENLDASTVLVMLNAVFFKGKWLKTFKPEDTKLGNFYLMNDTVKFVEMMHIYNADSFKYFESETFDAKFLQMFYSNRCFSMTIILPNKQEGIEDLKQYLYERGGLKMQLRQLRPVERINVTLPKFTIESALDLEPALRKIGLEEIFTQDADFSRMLENRKDTDQIFVSNVYHKTRLEVNEEGSRAAAGSGVQFALKIASYDAEDAVEFVVDHPFLFTIDFQSDADVNVLFHGVLYEP